jgi:L-iditol 2-dehydrogenase
MGTPIQTLPISAAALREVDLIGVFRYANTYPKGIELLSRILSYSSDAESRGNTGDAVQRRPDVRKLITHRFKGFENVETAFEMAGRAVDGDGKLVIKVVVEIDDKSVDKEQEAKL